MNGELTARLAARVAGTASPAERIGVGDRGNQWYRSDDPELQDYFALFDEVCTRYHLDFRDDGLGDNPAYASCGQAVGAVVRATVDPDWNMWGCADELECMRSREQWELMGTSDGGDVDQLCQPGDVLINLKHCLLYVGNRIAQEYWPGTDANFYEAAFTRKRYPGLTAHPPRGDGWGTFQIFRATGRGSWQRPFIDLTPWGL